MELKQDQERKVAAKQLRLNRTFMELKQVIINAQPVDLKVLIVPLWN